MVSSAKTDKGHKNQTSRFFVICNFKVTGDFPRGSLDSITKLEAIFSSVKINRSWKMRNAEHGIFLSMILNGSASQI